MNSLSKKTALVLGAGSQRGIGAAIARAYQGAGADVMLSARRADRLAETATGLGMAHQACDVNDEDSMSALFEKIDGDYGQLDIAVYAAGRNHFAMIDQLKPEDALPVISTQFLGALSFIQKAARLMKQGGSIILVSSLTAQRPAPGTSIYAGTKAAVEQVTRIAALEYGARGIRVNGIAPGMQRTDMTEALFENPALERAMVNETPLGRLGRPEEIASAALWLAGEDCFMTGATLSLAGGAELRRIPTFEEMSG